MRWYCWFIFCMVAVLSAWAFPADSVVDETSLLVVDSEQQGDMTIEGRILSEEEDEDDDEDDEEDGMLDVTGRHHKHGKPQKHKKDKDDSDDSEDADDKKGKKSKKKHCKCAPKKHHSKKPPHHSGNDCIKTC